MTESEQFPSASLARRDQVVECAIRLLGTYGSSALTHRTIDQELALPNGTTSNYFRTKPALLAAAYEWIASADLAEVDAARRIASAAPHSGSNGPKLVVAALRGWLDGESGLIRQRARLELNLVASYWPELWPSVRTHRTRFTEAIADFLAALGLERSIQNARILQAIGDGILLDNLMYGQDGKQLDGEAVERSLYPIFAEWARTGIGGSASPI